METYYKMTPKISVIIPVYNVEKYINKCIKSIKNQNYANFEALIIDDGSLDDSIAIAKEIIRDDSRFTILPKKNGGLSSARNFGIEHAKGDYIYFLDSDDYISIDCLAICMKIALSNPSVDIVLFGHHQVTENGEILTTYIPNHNEYLKQKDFLLSKRTIDYSVWSKIYKKSLFDHIRFLEGISYEDQQIMIELLHEKKLYTYHGALHYYVQRAGSIMNSYNTRIIEDYMNIYLNFREFMQKNNLWQSNEKYYLSSFLQRCYLNIIVQLAKYSPHYPEDCIKLKQTTNPNYTSWCSLFKNVDILSSSFFGLALYKISPILFKKLILLKHKLKTNHEENNF